jgi:hypothetical protein
LIPLLEQLSLNLPKKIPDGGGLTIELFLKHHQIKA